MLAGVNLQPGAWDPTAGLTDNILISDVTMHNVATPFHFSMRKGNTANKITVNGANITGVYRAAASVESWADTPFTNVVFRNISIEYTGGGTEEQAKQVVKAPGVDARSLPVWGFYARNVQNLFFDNVSLRCGKPDARPVLMFDNIGKLRMENLIFDHFTNVVKTVVSTNVSEIISSDKGNKF